jgi:hypothetical protein
MRRLLRILFNTLTVLSLVLALLVAGLWVRSYGRVDFFHYRHDGPLIDQVDYIGGFSSYGWLAVAVSKSRPVISLDAASPRAPAAKKLGFGGRVQPLDGNDPATVQWVNNFKYDYLDDPSIGQKQLTFRWWNVFAPFCVLPIVWGAMRYRRHRIVKAGRCLTCGYDLRATPDRCPECGTAKA